MKITELADAVERQGPSYELFVEAWFAIGRTDVDSAFTRFIELLDACAFLEAAMTLTSEENVEAILFEAMMRCGQEKASFKKDLARFVTAACLRAMEVE